MYRLMILLSFILYAVRADGQDMIYYTKNKTDKWKVTEINPQYIKAVDVSDTDMSYSTTPANVLFLFNRQGDFLVIPKLYDDAAGAEKKIRAFFQAKTKFHEFDKIVTDKNEVIICTYDNIDKDKVIYKVQGKNHNIDVSKVALIIFSSGQHKLFGSPDKAYKALNAVQEKYTDLAIAQEGNPAPDVKELAHAGKKIEESADTAYAEVTSALQNTGALNIQSPTTSKAPADSSANSVRELEPSTMSKLQNKALANIRQLGDYIQIICQKDTDPDELSKTIEQSLALFITDARIEVSSVNRSTVNQFKIRDYLVRMSMLKYEKVDIRWYNIQYTSQLRKGPDGFYYGTIEFEQRFVGPGSDNSKYEDVTRKSVEVVLKTYERNTGGQTTIEWDVFLGDIGVTITKTA